MRELVDSSRNLVVRNDFESFSIRANTVHSMMEALGKAGHKSLSYTQVVFATAGLGIVSGFVRNLCELTTQLSTQVFCLVYRCYGVSYTHYPQD